MGTSTIDHNDLTALLKLLDDESLEVRKAVLKALSSFGPSLAQELAYLPGPPNDQQIERIQALLEN